MPVFTVFTNKSYQMKMFNVNHTSMNYEEPEFLKFEIKFEKFEKKSKI